MFFIQSHSTVLDLYSEEKSGPFFGTWQNVSPGTVWASLFIQWAPHEPFFYSEGTEWGSFHLRDIA